MLFALFYLLNYPFFYLMVEEPLVAYLAESQTAFVSGVNIMFADLSHHLFYIYFSVFVETLRTSSRPICG